MLSIEVAIGTYTDMLNERKPIDLQHFKEQLTPKDYEEFLELIEVVKLTKAARSLDKFEGMFEQLDKYKNECFGSKPKIAAGFKGEETLTGSTEEKADRKLEQEKSKKINDLFMEEFGADEGSL